MIIVLKLACVTQANQDLGNEQTLADFEIRELNPFPSKGFPIDE